jgi:hypothetical protein
LSAVVLKNVFRRSSASRRYFAPKVESEAAISENQKLFSYPSKHNQRKLPILHINCKAIQLKRPLRLVQFLKEIQGRSRQNRKALDERPQCFSLTAYWRADFFAQFLAHRIASSISSINALGIKNKLKALVVCMQSVYNRPSLLNSLNDKEGYRHGAQNYSLFQRPQTSKARFFR